MVDPVTRLPTRRILTLAAVLATGIALSPGTGTGAAHTTPRLVVAAPAPATPTDEPDGSIVINSVSRDRRVYLVADSVGLGTRGVIDSVFGPDWQVTLDGTPALFVEMMEQRHVRPRAATTPWVFGTSAVVAGGYNYPHWDPARFDRSIDSILAALREAGVERVFWVTLREVDRRYVTASAWRQVQPYSWYFPTVNRHLERALARHPDLTLVDWAAAANRPGLTYDAIHLNTFGATTYSNLVRSTITSAASRVEAGSVTRIPIPDAAGVDAVALNLTTTTPRTTGFLTAYPCGGPVPIVSNGNHVRDQTVASAAIVPVGEGGAVCVYAHEATNLIVDVTGRFPTGSGIRPVAPRRLDDTRTSRPGGQLPAGNVLRVRVAGIPGVPADAAAVALSVTAVDATAAGFVSVAPCGEPIGATSSVNHGVGRATPNLVVVRPGTDGDVCLWNSAPTDLIVDVFASFDADAALSLDPARRVLDTRPSGARPAAGSTVVVDLAAHGVGAAATGVLVNLTATEAASDGYVTAFGCGTRPEASNLNVVAGASVANFALVRPDASGRLCLFTSGETHLLVDLVGVTGEVFQGSVPRRLLDTRAAR